jgi:hypothetical protein
MQIYEETLKVCDNVEPKDLIEIGGVLYEVLDIVDMSDYIWMALSLITVLPVQTVRSDCNAEIKLPRNLIIKTMK